MVGGRHHDLQIRLLRDTLSTQWGFRLQGGHDVHAPLTVQRVFVGSVADGQLHRGDIIVAIDNSDVTRVPHQVAEELIKRAGRDLLLTIRRGDVASNDFHAAQTGSYAPPWQQQYENQPEDENESKSVGEIRQIFSKPPPKTAGRILTYPQPGTTSYIPKRPIMTRKPNQPYEGIAEPGWVPKLKTYAPVRGPTFPQSPPVNRPIQQQQHYRPASEPIRHERAERPAWVGTLRSSGGPRLWEIQEAENLLGTGGRQHERGYARQEPLPRPPVVASPYEAQAAAGAVHNPRVQAVRYSPGMTPVYDQYSAEGRDSESARVAHLQYNTPLGLYSKSSAKEALEGQTQGKAGYGTMQITGGGGGGAVRDFDPAISNVYRLVLEEDEIRKHGGAVRGQGSAHPAATRAAARSQAQHQHQHQHQQPNEDQHSSHYRQLVHENDDQMQQYSATNHHYQQQQPVMRDVESRFHDMGVSDF